MHSSYREQVLDMERGLWLARKLMRVYEAIWSRGGNPVMYFGTFTVDPAVYPRMRKSKSTMVREVKNRVQDKLLGRGFQGYTCYEQHQDGGWHAHMVTVCDVSRKTYLDDAEKDWRFGHTSFSEVKALVNACKYMGKDAGREVLSGTVFWGPDLGQNVGSLQEAEFLFEEEKKHVGT